MHRTPSSRVAVVLAMALLVLAVADTASAQARRSRRGQPPAQQPQAQPGQPANPTQPAAAAQAPVYKPSPYIQRKNPKRWTLDAQIFIGASEWLEGIDGALVPKHDVWVFDAATIVFPVVPETGSSVLEVWGPADAEVPAVVGEVQLQDKTVASEVAILMQDIGGGPLPCGTWRAQWQVEPGQGPFEVRELELDVKTSQACYETVFDEASARTVEWPTGAWPADAEATFRPQMLVDTAPDGRGYNPAPITDLVNKWMEGNPPTSLKPVVLAKYLAGKVAQHVQITGEGYTFDRTGMWQGFDTGGAAEAAAAERGTEVDIACLLVAVYRAVGLPSRLVIGWDKESKQERVYLKEVGGSPAIRVWVEFCLYDEPNQTVGWVPVDVAAIRKKSSRLPDNFLDQPLKFFGTHDELDMVAPIAFHFHPPTSVRAYGAPAFWGWFVTPTPPDNADERVRFNMNSTPRGGRNESHLPARLLEPAGP